MKWIVLAIVVLIVPYTYLTLHYRKDAPAFQPYEDLKNRANVSRLLSAGYQRIPLTATRPADAPRHAVGASVLPAPGGVPDDLRTTLVEPPLLATTIVDVKAAAQTAANEPYAIHLTCTLPDDKQQLRGAELYVRGDTLVLMPTFEPVTTGLATRSRETAVLLTVPAGALKPGAYHVTLVGERASRGWPLEVK